MKDVVIIGAGVSGLTAAYFLTQKGFKVTLVEKESRIGGLARSFQYDDYTFDIGPHRFYAEDEEVTKFIEDILEDKINKITRQSGVWMFGKYHNWPLRPNIIFNLPPGIIWRVLRDFIFKSGREENTFEGYAHSRYGKTLYNIFFKPYSEKFLNGSVSKIHADWLKESIERAIINKNVKMDNLYEIFRNTFIPKQKTKSFLYPVEGGIGNFSEELAGRIRKSGGKILLHKVVDEIRCNSPTIREVIINGRAFRADTVIWTAPLGSLSDLLKIEPLGLKYLSLICYNLEVTEEPKVGYQWCYYGEKDVTFSRVSVPSLFSAKVAPEGKSGLCVEVPCLEGDSLWQNPVTLIDSIKKDLTRTGQIESPESIRRIHIEKIQNSYPIYELDYNVKLDKFKKGVSRFNNLLLLGRSGTFWYNNMDHSIKAAMQVSRKLMN